MPTLDLCADLDRLTAIRDFVVRTGQNFELDESFIHDLELAVDEACSNIICHAYHGHAGRVRLTLTKEAPCVRVAIQDWGCGFDPHAVLQPDLEAPPEQRPLGGLGLYLMREIMDKVEFQFEGGSNTLVMEKIIKGGQDDPKDQYFTSSS